MPRLARQLGLASLIFYGIGDILGAGIYALVGKVIETTGTAAWISFVLSGIVALVTGLSYAEMSSRYPISAGAAAFIKRGFPHPLMATVAGVIVMAAGIVSAATVTVAFSEYLRTIVSLPSALISIVWIAAVSFLSFWGIKESSRVNIALTLVETAGLLAVIALGVYLLPDSKVAGGFWSDTRTHFDLIQVLKGVGLAFYAFIGFEDLANLAEECRNPRRDLPRAILIAIVSSILIYVLITLALLLNVEVASVRQSDTPLLLVFEKAGLGAATRHFALVAMLAITNTGLLNLIMASRLSYGMAEEGLLPKWIGKVHPRRKTPWVGVLLASGSTLLLVYTGGLKVLAQTTSFLILIVFILVHLSLIRVKRSGEPHEGIRFPAIFPYLGVGMSGLLLAFFPLEVWLRSCFWIGLGVLVWLLQRNRGRSR